MACGVSRTRIAPGVVIDEWKTGRGYVLVYKKSCTKSDKALIFVHGGSFTALSPNESAYVFMAQEICRRTGLTVIVPDYPLAPFQHYPAQPNSILKTRMHFTTEFKEFFLGSDSAGGAIAWSMLSMNPSAFSRAWFLSPWLNLRCDSNSYTTREYCTETGQGDRLYKGSAKQKKHEYETVALQYLGKVSRLNDPTANPFMNKKATLKKFPDTLLLVGDSDSIRDDGLIMAGRLQDAGSLSYVSIYDDMWHDWMLYSQRSCPKQGQAAYTQICNFMQGHSNDCSVPQTLLTSVNASVILSTKKDNR
jgi:acetyl esterase/lipase